MLDCGSTMQQVHMYVNVIHVLSSSVLSSSVIHTGAVEASPRVYIYIYVYTCIYTHDVMQHMTMYIDQR